MIIPVMVVNIKNAAAIAKQMLMWLVTVKPNGIIPSKLQFMMNKKIVNISGKNFKFFLPTVLINVFSTNS